MDKPLPEPEVEQIIKFTYEWPDDTGPIVSTAYPQGEARVQRAVVECEWLGDDEGLYLHQRYEGQVLRRGGLPHTRYGRHTHIVLSAQSSVWQAIELDATVRWGRITHPEEAA